MLESMIKTVRHYWTRKVKNNLQSLILIAITMLLGVATLLMSTAATSSLSVEPENGTKSRSTLQQSSVGGFSGNGYVKFALPSQTAQCGGNGLNGEREGFQNFINAGFIDTFRFLHPDETEAYTWWTHWANARTKNLGWRIDYWLASDSLKNKINSAEIYPKVMGSDHCPVSIEITL